MIPQSWSQPCGYKCTNKFAALTQMPWRVYCKKGCDADGETWDECREECEEICYKDPVFKGREWSAYFDRSPGAANCSQECFKACIAGCGFKFEVPSEKVDEVRPKNHVLPPPPPPVPKPPASSHKPTLTTEDNMPSTSA